MVASGRFLQVLGKIDEISKTASDPAVKQLATAVGDALKELSAQVQHELAARPIPRHPGIVNEGG